MTLTLAIAQDIVRVGLDHARQARFRPLCVVILDARAAVIAAANEDGGSLGRFDLSQSKAAGALAFNIGSRALGSWRWSGRISWPGPPMRWAGCCRWRAGC